MGSCLRFFVLYLDGASSMAGNILELGSLDSGAFFVARCWTSGICVRLGLCVCVLLSPGVCARSAVVERVLLPWLCL